ncbi:GNAT family N-acetyltransferase [Shewanella sp. SG44-6]|jgi:GNAT superfamily N-acetyltransferase|uniref:GNAT family N-acetyltransferase n=1 Tax=Shewanella sp. SG44-6 TaxID=2760959 RepID=UPI0015FEC338|nr:GNAT family N-acetyltransferase [Shewanella sp. SG44-6]MBB1389440.1 GNAT family N-acetyltransferase [Shewanella sp. SG44-6]
MYQATWLEKNIIAKQAVAPPSVGAEPIEADLIANKSIASHPTAVEGNAIELAESKLSAIKLCAIKEWSAIKLFYRQHMPYARLAQKEAIAVINHLNSNATDNQDRSDDVNRATFRPRNIIAAIRVKPIGHYQLVNGLLVHPDYRGQHHASHLLQFIAPRLKTKHCFLFAHPWLIGLYQQQHFVAIEPLQISQLPAEITQLYYRYHSEERPLVLMQLNNPEQ